MKRASMRPLERWLFPLPIAMVMALGAIIGTSWASQGQPPADPDSMAGAQNAIVASLCFVAGFGVSLITLVVAAAMRRGAPSRGALRLGLALVSGAAAGAMALTPSLMSLAWVALLGGPAAAAWTWRADARTPAPTS